jgi:hypothetical protein
LIRSGSPVLPSSSQDRRKRTPSRPIVLLLVPESVTRGDHAHCRGPTSWRRFENTPLTLLHPPTILSACPNFFEGSRRERVLGGSGRVCLRLLPTQSSKQDTMLAGPCLTFLPIPLHCFRRDTVVWRQAEPALTNSPHIWTLAAFCLVNAWRC